VLKVTAMLGRFDELPHGDQAQAIDLARLADEAGLHAIALGEHLALGTRLENYPYEGGLRHPEAHLTPYLEPISVLSAAAAVTSNVRLSNCILLAPLRPALLLAKQLATIDVLSRGRCEPVFGVGWQALEFEAENVVFAQRRQILRDNIAACRALWGEQPASFTGPTVSFDELYCLPRPIQQRIPIILALKPTEKNVMLIAELCDGWEAGPDASKSPAELRAGVTKLRRAFVDAGRNPDELIVKAHLPVLWANDGTIDIDQSFVAAADQLEAGVNQFAFPLPVGYGDALRSLDDVKVFFGDIARAAAKY
jgi:probable F420-dependent oxidoreductase